MTLSATEAGSPVLPTTLKVDPPKAPEQPAVVAKVDAFAPAVVAAQAASASTTAKLELEVKGKHEIQTVLDEVEAHFKEKEKEKFNSEIFAQVKQELIGLNESSKGLKLAADLNKQRFEYQKECFLRLPQEVRNRIATNLIDYYFSDSLGDLFLFVEFVVSHSPVKEGSSPDYVRAIYFAAAHFNHYPKVEDCLRLTNPKCERFPQPIVLCRSFRPASPLFFIPPFQLKKWLDAGLIDKSEHEQANKGRAAYLDSSSRAPGFNEHFRVLLAEEAHKIETTLRSKPNFNQDEFDSVTNLFRYPRVLVDFPDNRHLTEYFLALPEGMKAQLFDVFVMSYRWSYREGRDQISQRERPFLELLLNHTPKENEETIFLAVCLNLTSRAESCLKKKPSLALNLNGEFIPKNLLDKWFKEDKLLNEKDYRSLCRQKDSHDWKKYCKTEIDKLLASYERQVEKDKLPSLRNAKDQLVNGITGNNEWLSLISFLPEQIRNYIANQLRYKGRVFYDSRKEEALKPEDVQVVLENSTCISGEIFLLAVYSKSYKKVRQCLASKLIKFPANSNETLLRFVPWEHLQQWQKEGILTEQELDLVKKAIEQEERQKKENAFLQGVMGQVGNGYEILRSDRSKHPFADPLFQYRENIAVVMKSPLSQKSKSDIFIHFDADPYMLQQGYKPHITVSEYHDETGDQVIFRVTEGISSSYEIQAELVRKVAERMLPVKGKMATVVIDGRANPVKGMITAVVLRCFTAQKGIKEMHDDIRETVARCSTWLPTKESYMTAAYALAFLRT